jgi:hypothetical protein
MSPATGRHGRPRLLLAGALAAAIAAVTACGPTPPSPSPSPLPSASGSPTPSLAGPSATATPSPVAPTPSATIGTPPSLPAGMTVDPGLLEVLPAVIDGVTLQPDPDTAARIASDPLLAESALSIAVALAAAPDASGGDDLAVASVIRLRPDVFDEAFYQEWRDTYDEAACEVADGVETQDETEIAGRQVYVATCGGGAMTYHTYLLDQNFIVSVTASGPAQFGELIMAGLAG